MHTYRDLTNLTKKSNSKRVFKNHYLKVTIFRTIAYTKVETYFKKGFHDKLTHKTAYLHKQL